MLGWAPNLLLLPLGSLLEHPWLWETQRQNDASGNWSQRVGIRLVTCVRDIRSGSGPGQSHRVSFGKFKCLLMRRCGCRDTFPVQHLPHLDVTIPEHGVCSFTCRKGNALLLSFTFSLCNILVGWRLKGRPGCGRLQGSWNISQILGGM